MYINWKTQISIFGSSYSYLLFLHPYRSHFLQIINTPQRVTHPGSILIGSPFTPHTTPAAMVTQACPPEGNEWTPGCVCALPHIKTSTRHALKFQDVWKASVVTIYSKRDWRRWRLMRSDLLFSRTLGHYRETLQLLWYYIVISYCMLYIL